MLFSLPKGENFNCELLVQTSKVTSPCAIGCIEFLKNLMVGKLPFLMPSFSGQSVLVNEILTLCNKFKKQN